MTTESTPALPAAPEQPLRIALIGCGRIAQKHLEGIRQFPDHFELVAVCDANESAAAAVAESFELPRSCVYTDHAALIREQDLAAVDICTVHDQHHAHAKAALDAGLHVLLEKPMAVTMDQCRDLTRTAEAAHLTLMIAHNQRFKANYRALRKSIAAGELGQVRAMRAESAMNVLHGAPPGHWVYDGRRAGGGVAISLGLHRIDLFRFLVGDLKRVTSAVCKTFEPRFTHNAEDYAIATFEFAPSAAAAPGAIAEFFATYTPWRTPWGESFVVYGDKGTAHAMPLAVKYNAPVQVACETRLGPELRPGRGGFTDLPLDPSGLPTGEMFLDELLHFSHCVHTGQEPLSSARAILGTMQAVFALYESARRQQPVDLAEI